MTQRLLHGATCLCPMMCSMEGSRKDRTGQGSVCEGPHRPSCTCIKQDIIRIKDLYIVVAVMTQLYTKTNLLAKA